MSDATWLDNKCRKLQPVSLSVLHSQPRPRQCHGSSCSHSPSSSHCRSQHSLATSSSRPSTAAGSAASRGKSSSSSKGLGGNTRGGTSCMLVGYSIIELHAPTHTPSVVSRRLRLPREPDVRPHAGRLPLPLPVRLLVLAMTNTHAARTQSACSPTIGNATRARARPSSACAATGRVTRRCASRGASRCIMQGIDCDRCGRGLVHGKLGVHVPAPRRQSAANIAHARVWTCCAQTRGGDLAVVAAAADEEDVRGGRDGVGCGQDGLEWNVWGQLSAP